MSDDERFKALADVGRIRTDARWRRSQDYMFNF